MIRIAIIHVVAEREEVLRRAAVRADATGRAIPMDKLIKSINGVPASVAALSPRADAVVTIRNADDQEPVIVSSRVGPGILGGAAKAGADALLSWDDFAAIWDESGK